MPYRFNCLSCKEYVYTEQKLKKNTNYECTSCNTPNWLSGTYAKFEEIDDLTFENKEKYVSLDKVKKIDTSIKLDKTEALSKLKESKEHLDLELISQEEYDKIKEELRPFIVLTDDKKSEKINEKLNKLTDKNKIDVTQIEKEPKPLSPPVNLNDIGYLSPMKQWSWTGYWWIDISEMFEGATTKKVLESVNRNYPALIFLSKFANFIAWLGVISSLVGYFIYFFSLNRPGLGEVLFPLFPIILATFIIFVFWRAISEILILFVDIAKDVREIRLKK